MVNEALIFGSSRSGAAVPRWLVESVFVALLLLVFVGLTPFEIPPTGAAALAVRSGSGDFLRQLVYVAVFSMLAIFAFRRHSLSAIAIVPLPMLLLLLWCFLSVIWSDVPGVSLRRAGLELIVICSAMLGVEAVGPKRSLELLRYVLIGVLIVNWVSIPLIHQAVHLPGEGDPGLVGDWRGLYFHKNIAGAVCALTAIILFYFAVARKSWLDFALVLAAIGFTVMSRSKSSLGFLPMAGFLGLVYGWGWKRDIDRWIVTVGAVLVAVLIAGFIASHTTQLARKLDNPDAFTGRASIWQAELAYIADHPFLGAGYGTFADTGKPSPLSPYVDNEWVDRVSHGHNGYLQVTVTMGFTGFVLAMLALVGLPLSYFWRHSTAEDLAFKALLFALFGFSLLHNLLESDFLEGDGPAWFMLLLVIAMLRTHRAETRLKERPG